MIVAGVMSGTSADGIDVALVRITRPASKTNLKLLGHASFPYPAAVRRIVLDSMNSGTASVAGLARLNFLLGELYAEAVTKTQKKVGQKAELVGCHGQTLYHQGTPVPFLGKKMAVTWQTGEAAIIATRTGVPVVSDFRPTDMAAGGKGAPLVPYLDYLLYRDAGVGRIALNIGGIANLTAIPAGALPKDVTAFDTGPGNMLIDALAEKLFDQAFDRGGRFAASGKVDDLALDAFLGMPFFRQRPPKTAGREEFGREFARGFLKALGASHALKSTKGGAALLWKWGAVATATALTARSIADSVKHFILPRGRYTEMIASGGGTRNPTLMAWLAKEMRELSIRLRSSDEFGIPSEAKEAVAFAVLAFETWHRRPSNVPSATGAKRPAVLGKVSYP
jgi:anhydro-N-acetylmuramic acid kinase